MLQNLIEEIRRCYEHTENGPVSENSSSCPQGDNGPLNAISIGGVL